MFWVLQNRAGDHRNCLFCHQRRRCDIIKIEIQKYTNAGTCYACFGIAASCEFGNGKLSQLWQPQIIQQSHIDSIGKLILHGGEQDIIFIIRNISEFYEDRGHLCPAQNIQ